MVRQIQEVFLQSQTIVTQIKVIIVKIMSTMTMEEVVAHDLYLVVQEVTEDFMEDIVLFIECYMDLV